jgi:hypothetical protein
MPPTLPRYPVFVPTKGRWDTPLTIRFLQQDEVPFRIVVRPDEVNEYAKLVDASQILVLPSTVTNLMETRNWIRDVAEQEGHKRHWQLDDNSRRVYRLWYGQRIPCDSGPALRCVEDFSDRYRNVGVSGLNYKMFGLPNLTAYFLNAHVYSCTLVNHEMPLRWRLVYNDDTDLCLQALAAGWATVLVNTFLIDKLPTMIVKGGNTDDLYKIGESSELEGPYAGDGRRQMARALERAWPGVVTVDRRFQRPQHVIDWKRFKFPLLPADGVTIPTEGWDEYGLELRAVNNIKSERIKQVLAGYQETAA